MDMMDQYENSRDQEYDSWLQAEVLHMEMESDNHKYNAEVV